MTDISALFEPFSIKSLTIPNRIVMAPMTRSFANQGIPGPDIAEYYRKRAAGEVGLILSEGTVIERPGSRNEPGIPFFHGEIATDRCPRFRGHVRLLVAQAIDRQQLGRAPGWIKAEEYPDHA